MFQISTRRLIVSVAAVCCIFGHALVCRANPYDVQSLQSALEDGDSVMEIQKYISRLKTVSELLAASQLSGLASRDAQEQFSPIRGGQLANLLDNNIRKPLLNRVDAIVKNGSALSKQALAVRISELKIMTGFQHPNAEKRYRDFIIELSKQLQSLILAENGQPQVKEAAAKALGKILFEPKSAVGAIASLLGPKRTVGEKRAAADSLNEMVDTHSDLWLRVGSSNNMLLQKQTLLELADLVLKLGAVGLADSDLNVRKTSLRAIGQISDRLEGASLLRVPPATVEDMQHVMDGEPELRPILKDFNLVIQEKAFKAALSDADPTLRLDSRKILEQLATIRLKIFLRQQTIPEKDRPEVDWLIEGLKNGMNATFADLNDPNPQVRLAAVEFLERLALPSEMATRGLSASMRDRAPFVRWSAARALGRMGHQQLLPLSKSNTSKTFDEKSMGQIIDGLAIGLNDSDVDVRTAVANIISTLALSAQSANNKEMNSRAVTVLRNAVPSLVAASTKGDGSARISVLKALYYTGVNDGQVGDATNTLIRVLKNREPSVRRAAAETLGSFGKAAATAVPVLRQALQDDDAEVRKAAGDAILQILP